MRKDYTLKQLEIYLSYFVHKSESEVIATKTAYDNYPAQVIKKKVQTQIIAKIVVEIVLLLRVLWPRKNTVL